MSAAIKLFLQAVIALPDLISAFSKLVGWLETQFGPDWPKRVAEIGLAAKNWNQAKSKEEIENAVKDMARALNSKS